jgi:hypothetical protein
MSVFSLMPSLLALMREFIIEFLSLSCGGRSLAIECAFEGNLSALLLEWSRIPAWGVGNLGSNPSDPTT